MGERDEGRNRKDWNEKDRREKMTEFSGSSGSMWVDNECNLHLDEIRLCGHLSLLTLIYSSGV